jgi:rubrerythrin
MDRKRRRKIMDLSDYKKIITFAIQAEIDARDFYRAASEKVAESHLKKLFSDLAQEEEKHEKILQGLFSHNKLGSFFKETRDYRVSETVKKPVVSNSMKPADAIALAMKNEEEAMTLYIWLAEGCDDLDQKRVFEDLAAMERDHKFKMEETFVGIAFPEAW